MRNPEFNKEQVLRAAIKAFVCKGYNKTSMQDLKQATGLHPGSIYCAFGNKQGLLIAALEQYNQDSSAKFIQLVSGHNSVLAGLKKYIENTVSECSLDGAEKACFSQQVLSDLSHPDPIVEEVIATNVEQWKNGFTNLFEQALDANEIDNSRTPLQRTQSVVMGIYGLRTYAHSHPSSDVLKELAQQLFEDVCR
ncbi:TetR/AcrR family transcriptional regulator [Paraglaciecola aquimarina]|uniref:TetR/AcrR family transcriptional regulator n=1 Tax=Paraglaciecola algarum TaxID=3050085 RepID=A0ABS9D5H5_9ALTE|nr:TetR/AcrR family transcriptional regulator [Paraglaciecola sp. G1-23]MCF2948025.1 TetR/AcrR family transcriptional regulator [Paraglaciecola sp. G1-23]